MTDKLRRTLTHLIHDGAYAAQVDIEVVYDANWMRTIPESDVRILDTVRLALRAGNITEAAKYGRVFELTPVAAN